jgi:virulence factor
MIKELIRKANQFRKRAYFNSSLYKTNRKYAFVGFGMHSLTNLYPIISHFGIPLKYICTRESSVSINISVRFPGTVFTNELELILNDPEIEGVFVSADPTAHAQILTSLLLAGKKVFIEKPPCTDIGELEKIILLSKNAVVKVGLQRRYWPGNKYILKNKERMRSYIYRFYFGPYLQGDVFNEMFIHAVDYCIFLFGEFAILSSSQQKYDHGITVQLHIKHSSGVSGLLELSTHGSWSDPVDSMSIQCVDEILEVKYPVLVEGRLKPKRIFNIPSERFLNQPVSSKKYFSINNLVLPVFELNTLILQGFYDELRVFIEMVENGNREGLRNDLIGLRPVYRILDELKKYDHPIA